MLAAGIGSEDEVIIVPYTFVATLASILYTGTKPAMIDVDSLTYCMDVAKLETVII